MSDVNFGAEFSPPPGGLAGFRAKLGRVREQRAEERRLIFAASVLLVCLGALSLPFPNPREGTSTIFSKRSGDRIIEVPSPQPGIRFYWIFETQ
ncbi:MAG: hypothetical protein AB7G93_16600 [Bdellovibrionales bacterium]